MALLAVGSRRWRSYAGPLAGRMALRFLFVGWHWFGHACCALRRRPCHGNLAQCEKSRMKFIISLTWLLTAFLATNTLAKDGWMPLKDVALTASKPGNALDFSALLDSGPAGRYGWATILPNGHIGFERKPSGQRFLAASFAFSSGNGGIPDKATTDRLVIELQRTGYNLVRLHFVDAQLMTGRDKDFDFDTVQFDRLHYLMAKLKEVGIYWIVDGLTSNNAAYGDVRPNRYVKKHAAKIDALVNEAGFSHWSALVERLWAVKNPYTGIAPIRDEAMLGVILVNEGSVGFLATTGGNKYPAALAAPFRAWLFKRYLTDFALRQAWGTALDKVESLTGVVSVPDSVRGNDPRDKDFAKFLVDLEVAGFNAMNSHVRRLGFKGLTTAFDNWGFLNADVTRAALPWVDMHSYHALPSAHGQPGSRIAQTSVHTNVGRYVRELTNARQWGKPFTVSEYGQPFWNQWRHESAALVPALAAHQGWDAICLFAESPISFEYAASPFRRQQAMYPFGVGNDPIARAGERLAAMLFLRGDVASSTNRIRLHLDQNKLLTRSGGWEQVPEGLSRLGFISAIGLDFSPMPKDSAAGELSVDLTGRRPPWLSQLETGLLKAGVSAVATSATPLIDADIIDSTNISRPKDLVFQSDTKQILLDSGAGRISVNTAKSLVAVSQGGDIDVGNLSARALSGPALIAVSSLDGLPVSESRRLLMWVLTDAINSGMTFEDSERTTIRAVGNWPPMVRTVRAAIRLQHGSANRLRVWPLSLNGERRDPLKVETVGGALKIDVDTASLTDGPALFYEIATE